MRVTVGRARENQPGYEGKTPACKWYNGILIGIGCCETDPNLSKLGFETDNRCQLLKKHLEWFVFVKEHHIYNTVIQSHRLQTELKLCTWTGYSLCDTHHKPTVRIHLIELKYPLVMPSTRIKCLLICFIQFLRIL